MVEVTVWPELFERTQDLWIEGNIVLMQVRAKERNGRLQVAVQQVELFERDESAASSFIPPTWLTKDQGAKNGEPRKGSAKPEAPATTTPAPPATSDTRPPPEADPPLAEETGGQPTAVATARRTALRIDLRETEDEDADKDRLQQLLAALRDYPGEDNVRLTVHTLDGGSQRVALPSARACPELTERLSDLLSDAGEAEAVVGGSTGA